MIRRAELRDKDEWLRMRVALWPECPLEKHIAEIGEFFTDEGTLAAFVATRAVGGLAGFLEASIRPFADGCDTRSVGYIEGWYVDPDLRGQGIGTQLVRAAEAWAAVQGCREMASDCIVGNEAALQAHLALGYEETQRLIHFKKLLDFGDHS